MLKIQKILTIFPFSASLGAQILHRRPSRALRRPRRSRCWLRSNMYYITTAVWILWSISGGAWVGPIGCSVYGSRHRCSNCAHLYIAVFLSVQLAIRQACYLLSFFDLLYVVSQNFSLNFWLKTSTSMLGWSTTSKLWYITCKRYSSVSWQSTLCTYG